MAINLKKKIFTSASGKFGLITSKEKKNEWINIPTSYSIHHWMCELPRSIPSPLFQPISPIIFTSPKFWKIFFFKYFSSVFIRQTQNMCVVDVSLLWNIYSFTYPLILDAVFSLVFLLYLFPTYFGSTPLLVQWNGAFTLRKMK